MSNNILRIVGDVHGNYREYFKAIDGAEYSLQVGDMGFDYSALDPLSFNNHKFFGGNHDNYDIYNNCPFAIGDWGNYTLNGVKFFFVRGEFSIDWKQRINNEIACRHKTWWIDEQIKPSVMQQVFNDYCDSQPDIMITHGWPRRMAEKLGHPDMLRAYGFDPDTFTTHTQELLEACMQYHMPKLWVGGHMHVTKTIEKYGCTFRCLNILETIDIDSEGNIL